MSPYGRTGKRGLQVVATWVRRQPPKVKAFLAVIAGMASLVFLRFVVHDHDNLFVAAEASHAIGISILIYKLIKEKTCAGLSLKSQELTAIFLAVRLYCSFVMEYDIHTILDTATLVTTLWVIYMIRFKLRSSYMEDKDNFAIYYVVIPCAILALVVHPSTSHNLFNRISWAFCVYLEAVSVLPQLRVMQNTKIVEPFTAHYVFALGIARFLSCAHWVLQVLDSRGYLLTALGHGMWPSMVLLSEIVQTFILADFCGKSRLSIDLATHFPAEIVNSDKMQVYKGLDIVTNKITEEERCGVPHHLLGVVDPDSEFTAPHFRYHALKAVESITKRRKLPVIAGGSNSFIEALVDDEDYEFRSRYDCLFLWVDVSLRVLHNFVSERVDSMVEVGLVDEVRKMFDHNADYTRGIRRAIGVPELDRYLRAEPNVDKETREHLLQEAIDEIKVNNCKLACCQWQKIHRLASLSHWNIHRIDATEVFRQRGKDADDTWERLVAAPSIGLLHDFLYNNNEYATSITTAAAPMTAPVTAVAASL